LLLWLVLVLGWVLALPSAAYSIYSLHCTAYVIPS
jgi:hypothetical protein